MKNNNIHFPHHPFDYNYLIDQLKNYHFPRNKIQKTDAFYGATALRIFYGLNRFYEDLDFSLLETNNAFELTPYMTAIQELSS
jgi:hypothetical protein